MKTHLLTSTGAACGRSDRGTDNIFRVNCLACAKTETYIKAMMDADAKREAAFWAQEPRTIGEPWGQYGEIIACKSCGSNRFRRGDRTCYGHYDNFHCADCGNIESRLTETGMSF